MRVRGGSVGGNLTSDSAFSVLNDIYGEERHESRGLSDCRSRDARSELSLLCDWDWDVDKRLEANSDSFDSGFIGST